ncbi:MAG: tRNA (N6-threonylcarbamoyladenosine(37)-N6)-methyltransferase TrmO [Clostridium sp.]|nr:tRNA (N6-threonylcarbamoyladenosine(37)-N6)-methyltransferase TrmO [Clostridium sp.]
MNFIGRVYTDLPDKFGVPRQAGNVPALSGKIIFDSPYNVKEAFEGIEEFSHLWILWQFSESVRDTFSPTVRPPRLNGNKRKGVFATRSPFRPNSIGMSCVKLDKVAYTKKDGVILCISGVDMMNGTPVYDVKPYITYTDSHPDAKQGFAQDYVDYSLEMDFPAHLLERIPLEKQQGIIGVLRQDPRPAYHNDAERIYGVRYLEFDIKFKVDGKKLFVTEVK